MMVIKNIIANYVGTIVAVALPVITIPWFISQLGIKQWGLLSFVILLQSILGIVNSGISQGLMRQVADRNYDDIVPNLLYGLEKIYWLVSMFIGVVIIVFSECIIDFWIKWDGDRVTALFAIIGAAILLVIQFPLFLYRSVLIGKQFQIKLNKTQIFTSFFRYGGAFIVVWIYKDIRSYILWMIVSGILEAYLLKALAWDILGVKRNKDLWSLSIILGNLRFFTFFSIAVLFGTATLQLDRIFISYKLPIEDLGYYAVAMTVSMGLMQLIGPISNAVIPKVVEIHSDKLCSYRFNIRYLFYMVILVLVGILLYAFLGEKLLSLWLKDKYLVDMVYPILNFLIVGVGLNALYSVGYANWIAAGLVGKIFIVNIISFLVALIATPIFIDSYGLLGAALGWVFINVLGLIFSLDWLFKRANP